MRRSIARLRLQRCIRANAGGRHSRDREARLTSATSAPENSHLSADMPIIDTPGAVIASRPAVREFETDHVDPSLCCSRIASRLPKTLTYNTRRLGFDASHASDRSRKPSPSELGGRAQRYAGPGTDGSKQATPANSHL